MFSLSLPRRSALVFLAFLTVSLASSAQQQASLPASPAPAPVAAADAWKAPAFSVDPKTLYEAATPATVPDGADVAILCDDQRYSFDEAGRLVHVAHFIYKVLTTKGAEGWDSLAVGWEPWHEARPVIQARVIGPDFSVHTLEEKSINETPAREGDYKIYSDGKTLRAPLPAVAVGVVVEEQYVERENQPFFAPGHVGRVTFGEERIATAHNRVIFEAPASLPLRTDTLLLPNFKPQREEANGKVTLTYDLGALDAIGPYQPNLPKDVARFPEVRFSTGESWQKMAVEYAKIVDSRVDLPSVQPIVDKLIAGKSSVAEKESAIIDYLDREVRYTGIEFGEAAIVPHAPSETLGQKYGDCKDKATLLVTMLRAAGIPAYVALLNAGSRMDVPPDLPGMGLFDHAIVYVPGAKPGDAGLWIDATDQYARLGQLPAPDQGRLALIARPETTSLTKTMESASKDNVLLELREIKLSENGPATVTEKTEPTGVFESRYRAYYADKPDKDMRESLSRYVKGQYVSEKLTTVDRSDPADLSKQFELTLACEKAKRGYTDLDNAVAAIRVEGLFEDLPDGMKTKDDPDAKKKQEKPDPPRTADWELNSPFSAEWRYRIVPPDGFVPKELPKDTKIQIGPALLTEEFKADADGVVEAHLLFDTVKRRFTAAEAKEMGAKISEISSGTAVLVNFEPRGEALLHEGKVKEALAAYRSLIALHPNEAVHHLQVANVLLEAGMGEAARDEARQAVKLDPTSALAEKVLAYILKHDLVGRPMRTGSDWAGAAEALRQAAKLDPDDHSSEGDLAILYEYDSVGRRYSEQSKMKEAIAEYRKLGQDKLADLDLSNNLAFALFYGGDAAAALDEAQKLNPQPAGLIGACTALLEGSKAGLAEINKRSNSDSAFKDTAKTAGEMLMNTRHYALAADFLEAGASGDSAAQTMGLASILRGAVRHEEIKFNNTPQDLARRFFLLSMDPDLTEAKLDVVLSRNALEVMKNEDADEKKKTLEAGKELNSQLARQESSLDVTEDILAQAVDPKGEGSDAIGYREKMQVPGGNNMTMFVVKENGVYKLLDTEEHPNSIGLEILDRIKAGNLEGAKALLDWMREDIHLEGGDDPYGGPVFPRFWIKGETADARKMRLAAAAILIGTKPTAAQGIAILEEALKDASGEREKTNIQLALSFGYSEVDNYSKLLDVASSLGKQTPESRIAFLENLEALSGLGRYDEALALAGERLKLLDNDTDAVRMTAQIEADKGDYKAAIDWSHKLVDQGKENAEVWNEIAWFALFRGNVNENDIQAAIKSTQLDKDNAHILHTLACLDAVAGKPKEAHDLLLRSMDDLNLDEPDDDYWYALGLIAEQYGEREIAIADYHKLKKPKEILEIPTSSWLLAQNRLKALGAESSTATQATLASGK